MTEDEKYEIAVLAEDLESKRAAFHMHQMLNTSGKTGEELTDMGIAYHIAHSELIEAEARMKRAKVRIAQKS